MSNTRPLHIYHVGLTGDRPGGMSQVVQGMLRWKSLGFQMHAIPTTRWRRDWLSVVLFPIALLRILVLGVRRYFGDKIVLIFHVSQGGSFVREGSLLDVARRLGLATGLFIHGSSFMEQLSSKPRITRSVIRRATQIYTLTAETWRVIHPNHPSVHLVRNAVHFNSSLPQKTRDRNILFVGDLSKRKGVDVLFTAWNTFQRQNQDGWKLLLIGRAGDVPFQPLPNCEWIGPQSQSDLEYLYASSRVVVLPSRAEAMPLVVLEGMASSCVVVASRVGEVQTLLDNDCGILVEPGDPNSLVTGLAKAVDSPAWDLARNAHRRAQEDYSPETVKKQFLQRWREISH